MYVSRVVKYNKNSFQNLKKFFMSTWYGFQKYAINLILTIGQTKIGQKIAAGWAGLAILSCM